MILFPSLSTLLFLLKQQTFQRWILVSAAISLSPPPNTLARASLPVDSIEPFLFPLYTLDELHLLLSTSGNLHQRGAVHYLFANPQFYRSPQIRKSSTIVAAKCCPL
ncbi:hypothetical protein J5N97_013180 [Dioscorea zingiberensis]|uniref:Uncharacterized protein n=1 Tax=Dioscorea zingiberensis TaxID=325984 RepID=A0A9D5CQ74_9LILI|nr:hypothetical protein J5N97_013180 [Dioscorea zingiberensis]